MKLTFLIIGASLYFETIVTLAIHVYVFERYQKNIQSRSELQRQRLHWHYYLLIFDKIKKISKYESIKSLLSLEFSLSKCKKILEG